MKGELLSQLVLGEHKGSFEFLKSYILDRPDQEGLFVWTNSQVLSHVEKHNKPWIGLASHGVLCAFILYNDFGNLIEVNYLETHHQFYRQGFMKSLLTQWLVQNQESAVWLDVHQENVPARGLYRQLGFKKTGLRKGYYRDGGSCLQLSRPQEAKRVL